MYTIYAHQNKINKKYYVGQTMQDISIRWRPSGYDACTKFYRAIQKYGWDNFEHIILEECETEEEANEREDYWITKLDSINNGYNILRGGRFYHNSDAIAQVKGKKVICLNNKTIYNSIAEAQRITGASHVSDCCKGKIQSSGQDQYGNVLYWKYLDDYTGQEKIQSKSHLRSKSQVCCLNTGIIYQSSLEASRMTGVDNGSINKVLNGIRHTAGKDKITGLGLVWIYIEEKESENTQKNIEYYQQLITKYNKTHDTLILCVETGEKFNTIQEAAKYAGLTNNHAYLIGYAVDNIKRSDGSIVHSAGKHPITGEKLHWQRIKV